MSTTGTEKHCRLCLMLNKGGTKACHSLLLRRVEELTPSDHLWDVNEFLQTKKKEILKAKLSKEKLQVLFPSSGITDLSKWDLSLFCTILTKYCDLSQLERLDMERLRTLRNDLCHMNEPTIDDMKYQDYFQTIKVVLERILKDSNDNETKQAIEKMLDDFHSGPLSLDETHKQIHIFYSMEMDIREKLENIGDVEERVLQKVEKIGEDVETLRSSLKQIDSKLDHEASSKLQLPGVEVLLDLKNLSQEEEERMSTVLEQLFEEVINENECFKSVIPSDTHATLRQAVRKTFQRFLIKGWRITSARHECVQLHIRCFTFKSLAALFREHIQGQINTELRDLNEAIAECVSSKKAVLETVIYKDEFWNIMDKTMSAVDDFLNDKESVDFDPASCGKPLPSSGEKKHSLSITARMVKHDGPQSLKADCANELESCLKPLKTKLETEFDAPHFSIQASYTLKIPENIIDEVGPAHKYAGTQKKEETEKLIPSTSKSISADVEVRSHVSQGKTSVSVERSDKEQTIALLELYRSQIAVAHFLKLAYMYVHGEFVSQIELTIQSARSAHEMSQFIWNDDFLLRHLRRRLSYILRRLRDGSLKHIGYVESTIRDARQLKDDAMELQGRYTKLLDAISSDTKRLTIQRKTKTANIRDKMSDLPSEKLADVDRSKAKKGMYEYDEYISTFSLPERLCISDSSDEDTDFGRNKLPEEMTAERKTAEYTGKYNLKHDEGKGQSKAKKSDDWRYTMGKRIPFGVVDLDTVLTKLRPGSALTGGLSLTEMIPSEMFQSIRHEKESGTLTKDMSQTQGLPGTVKPSFVHQTKYIEEVDSLETIKEQEGNKCIEYLQQVCNHLQNIDLQLTRIADSWSNLITALEQINANIEAVWLQIGLLSPNIDEKIHMLEIEKEWIFVSKTFDAYFEARFHIINMYDFLTDRTMFHIPGYSAEHAQTLKYKEGKGFTGQYLPQDPGKSSALHLATDDKDKQKSSKEHDSAESETHVL